MEGRGEHSALMVHALWDDEARVWVATSDDVPGLTTEADTVEQLVSKLAVMVPELLELNAADEEDTQVELVVPISRPAARAA